MLAKVESGTTKVGDPGNGRIFHDIEKISNGLYINKTHSRGFISRLDNRSKSVGETHFPDPKLKSRLFREDVSQKDKKSSIWNWKPLKALSHIRNRRFNCCFSLQVHSIEGLPSNFNNTSLCVQWRRKDGGLQTRPARVFQGIAEFEEILMHRCPIHVSGYGPHHITKYEAKLFSLYAYVVGASNLDLGEQKIDLTRLLPLTLEELEEEKITGKWTTSFKLSGEAKGATLNVSFGFLVVRDAPAVTNFSRNVPQVLNTNQNRLRTIKTVPDFGPNDSNSRVSGVRSLSGSKNWRTRSSRSVGDVKILHEVLPSPSPDLSNSINLLYQKINGSNLDTAVNNKPEFDVLSEYAQPFKKKSGSFSEFVKENTKTYCKETASTIAEQGIESPTNEHVKLEDGAAKNSNDSVVDHVDSDKIKREYLALDGNCKHQPCGTHAYEFVVGDCKYKESSDTCTKLSVAKELKSDFYTLPKMESAGVGSSQAEDDIRKQENRMEAKSTDEASKLSKSLSLDDITEFVANEFLNMLGIENSPFGLSSDTDVESPREQLLRQFEKDVLAGGNCIFDFDFNQDDPVKVVHDAPNIFGCRNILEDFESSPVICDTKEHQLATQAMKSKMRAKILEDLETEALMREWGLNEKAFQSSPPDSLGGFGSPIDVPPEEPLELTPLGEGLGPFIKTKDGGFLRSISPSLLRGAKNGGSLIMQVSSPVVLPSEMGSGIMEILQCLASVGIEKLSVQANKIMTLEDITGKTIQEVASEGMHGLQAPERPDLLQHGKSGQDSFGLRKKGKGFSSGFRSNVLNSSAGCGEIDSDYVSLEDLAPLAMEKVEVLSIEGLRIQSGMSDEDAPSHISSLSVREISALKQNINVSLDLEGAVGLQLLDVKDNGDDDGLMGLSLTLDEWMKLDSGIVDDEDQISERTLKILRAHHANCNGLVGGELKGDGRWGRGSGRKCGLLGNNFTVALMVQLRDPTRNYELVGVPMLALIQVERVFVPPKPKSYSPILEKRNDEDDEAECMVQLEVKDENEEMEVEMIPQFKVSDVHVSGLKTQPGKKKLCGTAAQQQSGSRWLIASGMGKRNKHLLMKPKAVAKSSSQMTTMQPGDTLWSISSRVHGMGAKWKDLAALNPHIRNPDIIFPNITIGFC